MPKGQYKRIKCFLCGKKRPEKEIYRLGKNDFCKNEKRCWDTYWKEHPGKDPEKQAQKIDLKRS